ncbi:MAG: hypothetical protein JWM41_904 [Gemmatimonadetes bacterium]|nr:hypothetical protein [Gemmatimonadota bacterium]
MPYPMNRCVRLVAALSVAALPITAHAQLALTGPRASAAIVGGASTGHETSGFLGGEGDLRITSRVAIFIEGGKVWNASTAGLDAHVKQIANVIGMTGAAENHIAYADAGIRLRVPLDSRVEPYVLGGFGAARVRTETTFSAARTAPPGGATVQLGNDLDGSVTKPMVTAGAGATIPLSSRLFGDLSARYGRILAKTSAIPGDQAIDLVRLQAGLGLRF